MQQTSTNTSQTTKHCDSYRISEEPCPCIIFMIITKYTVYYKTCESDRVHHAGLTQLANACENYSTAKIKEWDINIWE